MSLKDLARSVRPLRIRPRLAKGAVSTILAAAFTFTSGAAMAGGGGLPGVYAVTNVDGAAVPKDAKLSITFHENATFSGFAGCNTFRGPYKFVGPATAQTAMVGPLRVTEKACAPAVMTLETALLRAVGTTHTIERADDGAIVMRDEAGRTGVRLVFQSAE